MAWQTVAYWEEKTGIPRARLIRLIKRQEIKTDPPGLPHKGGYDAKNKKVINKQYRIAEGVENWLKDHPEHAPKGPVKKPVQKPKGPKLPSKIDPDPDLRENSKRKPEPKPKTKVKEPGIPGTNQRTTAEKTFLTILLVVLMIVIIWKHRGQSKQPEYLPESLPEFW